MINCIGKVQLLFEREMWLIIEKVLNDIIIEDYHISYLGVFLHDEQ